MPIHAIPCDAADPNAANNITITEAVVCLFDRLEALSNDLLLLDPELSIASFGRLLKTY